VGDHPVLRTFLLEVSPGREAVKKVGQARLPYQAAQARSVLVLLRPSLHTFYSAISTLSSLLLLANTAPAVRALPLSTRRTNSLERYLHLKSGRFLLSAVLGIDDSLLV
jgi:hypothetical protein